MTVQVQVRVGCHTRAFIESLCESQHQIGAHLSRICIQTQTLAERIDKTIIEAPWVSAPNVISFPINNDNADSAPMPSELAEVWNATTCTRLCVQELLCARLPCKLPGGSVVERAAWICIRFVAQVSAVFTTGTARPNGRTNVCDIWPRCAFRVTTL